MQDASEGILVKRAVDEADGQEVWIRRGRGGSLIVEERLSGELAYAIYEEQTHRHRISVATSLFPALAEALGCQAGEVPERVALLLGQEDAYLASLMDLLDGLGMPYSYVASAGEGVVSYRPELPS